jgi:hypothetical protein
MTGCSVQWKMNKITRMCYCWHNLGTVWLLLYYWISKLINVLLSPSSPNSHHLRRTTNSTNQQTTKWLAYYKCLKSDMFSTKCFKSDMLITSQWFWVLNSQKVPFHLLHIKKLLLKPSIFLDFTTDRK